MKFQPVYRTQQGQDERRNHKGLRNSTGPRFPGEAVACLAKSPSKPVPNQPQHDLAKGGPGCTVSRAELMC